MSNREKNALANGVTAMWLVARALAVWVVVLVTGCASLHPVDKPSSMAMPAEPAQELGRLAAQSVTVAGDSAFRPLPESAFSMDARLTLARHAQRSLDLQYYLLQNDSTGHTLLAAVRDAASRGVRVRILVDDMYTADSDRMLVELAAFPNIEIRLFNPFPAGREYVATRWAFSLMDFERVNHRMHNKMFIADGAFAVAGGRNIADEYFFHSTEGNFIDFDLLITGGAVPQMASIFDRYWNSRRVYPLEAIEASHASPESLRRDFDRLVESAHGAYPPIAPDAHDLLGYGPLSHDIAAAPLRLLHGPVRVIADDPEKVSGKSEGGQDRSTVTSQVIETVADARSQVLLASPYFVPGDAGMKALQNLRTRGVDVKVLTNSLAANDEPYASVAYSHYRKTLLESGVDIYEISPRELGADRRFGRELGGSIGRSHAKIIVIDRATTFVGSMNLDFRSSRENTEVGLLVDSPELAQIVIGLLDQVRTAGTYRLQLRKKDGAIEWVDVENGQTVVRDSEPEVGAGTLLKLRVLSPLIPEGLL